MIIWNKYVKNARIITFYHLKNTCVISKLKVRKIALNRIPMACVFYVIRILLLYPFVI